MRLRRAPVPVERGVMADSDRLKHRLGALLLLIAVVSVVASTSVQRPITGSPSAAPIPLPPPVGSCVLFVRGQTTVVPCEQPHNGEIVKTWVADDAPTVADLPPWAESTPGAGGQPYGLPSATYDQQSSCYEPAAAWTGWTDDYYAGMAGQTWMPASPSTWTLYVPAPVGERIGTRGWSACVIAPYDNTVMFTGDASTSTDGSQPTYVGSMHATAVSPRPRQPDAFGSCWTIENDMTAARCAEAHSVEWLGQYQLSEIDQQDGDFSRAVPVAELIDGCTALAAAVTRRGRSDLRWSAGDPRRVDLAVGLGRSPQDPGAGR